MSLIQYEIFIPYIPRVKNKCTLNLGERFKNMQAGDLLSHGPPTWDVALGSQSLSEPRWPRLPYG